MATILVVDRSRVLRAVLRHELESVGHTVLEAENGASARACVETSEVDAVLLAWELDDTPAPVLLQTWKRDARMRFVPVLMVTSHDEPERIGEAIAQGANDFLKKPVGAAELRARVANALRTRALQLELHYLATRDELTGLVNRRELVRRLEEEWRRTSRYRSPVSVAILDVNHFKLVNDRFGHDGGDAVLKELAALLQRGVRTVDVAGRFGGEEFLLLMPETPPAGAVVCIERLLAACRRATWLEGATAITFSAGIASLAGAPSLDAALKSADDALYEAKRSGRDRAVCAPAPPLT